MHYWNSKGDKEIGKQVRRVIDARAEHGKDSDEAKAEQNKFKVMERNPKYKAK